MEEYKIHGCHVRKTNSGWEMYGVTGGSGSSDMGDSCWRPGARASVDYGWFPVHPGNYPLHFRVCNAIDEDPDGYTNFVVEATNV